MNSSKNVQLVLNLFENDKIFLINGISLYQISKIIGITLEELEKIFEEDIEISFDEMLKLWRLTYARNILLTYKCSSKYIWEIVGFSSYKEFITAWDALFFN